MKKQCLVLMIMLLFVGGQAWGQDTIRGSSITFSRNLIIKPKILLQSDDGKYKIDFKNENEAQNGFIEIKPFERNAYPKSYKKGSTVKFRIHNVNFLKVKGSKVESKETNFSFDSSNELEKLLEKKEKENFVPEPGDKTKPNIWKEILLKAFTSDYKSFLTQLSSIESALALSNDLKSVVGQDLFVKDTSWIKGKADTLYEIAYNKGQGEDIYQKISKLKELYITLKDSYIVANDSLGQPEARVSGELKNRDGWFVKVSDAKISQTIKNKYADEFDFATKAIAVFNDEAKKKEIIQKVEAGTDLYYSIKRNDFIHYTDAIQLNDDFVTLTPRLHDADNKVIHEFEPLTIKTKTGVRVNFSTGYLLSFRGDEEYGYRRDLTDSIVGVNSLGNSNLTHGIGALVHVLRNCGANTQFGVSSGISLNANSKVNFHFGVSAGFVEANRLVFTFGRSLVNIKELDRSNLDAENNFVSPKRTDINYVERYRSSWFFGITYNLVNKK